MDSCLHVPLTTGGLLVGEGGYDKVYVDQVPGLISSSLNSFGYNCFSKGLHVNRGFPTVITLNK